MLALELYVTDSAADTIAVLSTSDMTQIRRINAPGGPRRLAIHKKDIYCALCHGNGLLYITKSQRSGVIPTGTYPVAVSCSGNYAYIACGESNSLWKLDIKRKRPIMCAPCGAFPICVCATDTQVVCASMLSGSVSVFNTELELVKTVPMEGMPICACQTLEGIFVCSMTGTETTVISRLAVDGSVNHVMELPYAVGCIAPLKDGNKAAVAYVWADRLGMLDLDGKSVIWSQKCGRMPDCIAIDEQEGSLYVSAMLDGWVEKYTLDGCLLLRSKQMSEPRGLLLKE